VFHLEGIPNDKGILSVLVWEMEVSRKKYLDG
jgi:hypothetical protein